MSVEIGNHLLHSASFGKQFSHECEQSGSEHFMPTQISDPRGSKSLVEITKYTQIILQKFIFFPKQHKINPL